MRSLIEKEHRLVKRSLVSAVEHAVRAGAAIATLDELSAHGETIRLREQLCLELGISERTARVYRQLHEGWPAIKQAMQDDELDGEPSHFSIRQALAIVRQRASHSESTQEVLPLVSDDSAFKKPKMSRGMAGRAPDNTAQADLGIQKSGLVPDSILDPALSLVGGTFTIDATSEPECRRVPAELHYTDGGLKEPWFESVFLHLTPGCDIEPWIAKLSHHLHDSLDRVSTCILLLPVDTTSGWFPRLVALGSCILFLAEHLTFYGHTTPAEFPSLVCYIGPDFVPFATLFSKLGPILQCAGGDFDSNRDACFIN